MSALKKIKYEESIQESLLPKHNKVDLSSRRTAEIIIGLCGPIGSPINILAETIDKIITKDYKYTTEKHKLSEFIPKLIENPKKFNNESERINTLIEEGNLLRANTWCR
jgi:hypothetical protein